MQRLFQCKEGNAARSPITRRRPIRRAKLVRCTKGALYDVALDLRPGSPSYLRWTGTELTATNHRALYIAEGCAHGFLTLEENTEALYQMSEFYHPETADGVRWNDPGVRDRLAEAWCK